MPVDDGSDDNDDDIIYQYNKRTVIARHQNVTVTVILMDNKQVARRSSCSSSTTVVVIVVVVSRNAVAPKLEFTVRRRRMRKPLILPRDNELNSVQKLENPDGRAAERPKADADLVALFTPITRTRVVRALRSRHPLAAAAEA